MADGVDGLVDALAADLSLPGIAVAVVRPGVEPTIVYRGMADAGRRRPVDRSTAFRIGSITKTMTTMAVLRLVEEGRVVLDDPITAHVPARIRQPRGSRPITVRDLLTHRSGLGELASWAALRHPMWAVGGSRAGEPPPSLATLAASGYRAEAAPGDRWVYANPGFTLLGWMVESVTGRPFADVLGEWVFEPCGMAHATLDPTAAPELAVGHKVRDGVAVPVRPFTVATVSAGGVIATIDDLAAYAAMLLDGGIGRAGRVVGEAMLAEAFRPQHQPHPAMKAIGLTFRIRRVGDRVLVGHNGSMPGWNAGLVLDLDAGVGAVALTNRSVPPAAEFGGGRVAAAVLLHVLGDEASRPRPVARPPAGGTASGGPASERQASGERTSDDQALGEQTAARPEVGVAAAPLDVVLDDGRFVGRYRPSPGVLTNFRAAVLFGGQLEVRRARGGLEVRGRAGPLRAARPLVPADAPATFRLELQGLELPVAFVDGPDGRVATMWLDGIPTAFALHRRRSPDVRLLLAAALVVGAATGLLRRKTRTR